MNNHEKSQSWDELRVFLAIVDAGSLSAASKRLGLSQPTVGRRLSALEDRVGFTLIERGPEGCVPTALGRSLIPDLTGMREAADQLERLLSYGDTELEGVVRVACGQLVAHHLLARLGPLLDEVPGLRLELIAGSDYVNLHRGEADLAIRNQRPRSSQLYARTLGRRGFAIYAAPSYLASNPAAFDRDARLSGCRWISTPSSKVPSVVWIERCVSEAAPRLVLSHSLLVLEAAIQGVGLAVLPTVIGGAEGRLVRVGEPLAETMFCSWLVCHASARRLPRVRWTLDAVAKVLTP